MVSTRLWLDGTHDAAFEDATTYFSDPFDILLDSDGLESVVAALAPGGEEQMNLFSPDRTRKDDLGENLRELQYNRARGLPLWKRFSKRTKTKVRQLAVPTPALQYFFQNYFVPFIENDSVHPTCHGGEKGWSARASLEGHLPFSAALSFDLSSAFERTSDRYVFGYLMHSLGEHTNLDESRRFAVATLLTELATIPYYQPEGHSIRGLPQGSTHALALYNRVLFPLDHAIAQHARERGMHVTRWVDDITITSPDCVDPTPFLGAVPLVGSYFQVHPRKTFFQVKPENPGHDYEGVYLLGHVIAGKNVRKNSDEKRAVYKEQPLDARLIYSAPRWE
ncbi:MAG: hypothetical protein ACP5NS_02120 [Candidatus Pacearchaeota archaeon]